MTGDDVTLFTEKTLPTIVQGSLGAAFGRQARWAAHWVPPRLITPVKMLLALSQYPVLLQVANEVEGKTTQIEEEAK